MGLHAVFADTFADTQFGLNRDRSTARLYDAMKRINSILLDMSRDIWQYISMDYFKQTVNDGEIGSSAMPHKVNPIAFENAKGNMMHGDAILEFLAAQAADQSPAAGLEKLAVMAASFSALVEELNWRVADQIGSHHDDGKYPQATSCEAAKCSVGGHVSMT